MFVIMLCMHRKNYSSSHNNTAILLLDNSSELACHYLKQIRGWPNNGTRDRTRLADEHNNFEFSLWVFFFMFLCSFFMWSQIIFRAGQMKLPLLALCLVTVSKTRYEHYCSIRDNAWIITEGALSGLDFHWL